MKRLFRSRVPPPLTAAQIDHLTNVSDLPAEDIEEWHERFKNCYPRGYLSREQFLEYLKQFHGRQGQNNPPKKTIIKPLFRLLDLNEDKQLNFEEFFLFNLLINQGSSEDKLRLILRLYDRDKDKYLTRQQLERVVTNMFDVLSIPKPVGGLAQALQQILARGHFNNETSKIAWNTFTTYVLEDRSLLQLLLLPDYEHEQFEEDSPILITRFWMTTLICSTHRTRSGQYSSFVRHVHVQ